MQGECWRDRLFFTAVAILPLAPGVVVNGDFSSD